MFILSTIVPHRCSLYNEAIEHNKDAVKPSERGLQTLKLLAYRWAKVDDSVCSQPPYCEFKCAAPMLLRATGDTVVVHERCRVSFRTRLTANLLNTAGTNSCLEQTTCSHCRHEFVPAV